MEEKGKIGDEASPSRDEVAGKRPPTSTPRDDFDSAPTSGSSERSVGTQPLAEGSALSRWVKWSEVLNNTAVPILLAVGAWVVADAVGDSDRQATYVEIAAGVLANKDADPQLRTWAFDLLSDNSPVPFAPQLAEGLQRGTIFIPQFGEFSADDVPNDQDVSAVVTRWGNANCEPPSSPVRMSMGMSSEFGERWILTLDCVADGNSFGPVEQIFFPGGEPVRPGSEADDAAPPGIAATVQAAAGSLTSLERRGLNLYAPRFSATDVAGTTVVRPGQERCAEFIDPSVGGGRVIGMDHEDARHIFCIEAGYTFAESSEEETIQCDEQLFTYWRFGDRQGYVTEENDNLLCRTGQGLGVYSKIVCCGESLDRR